MINSKLLHNFVTYWTGKGYEYEIDIEVVKYIEQTHNYLPKDSI